MNSRIVLNGSGTKIWHTLVPPSVRVRATTHVDAIDPHMFWQIDDYGTFLLYGQLNSKAHKWKPL
jgi:hypothetical protein